MCIRDRSGITFFNTLFDENASNHLAIGAAYATSVEGGADMTEAVSYTHLDVYKRQIWSVGQGVKTPPFHGGNTGSNPVRTILYLSLIHI